MYIKGIKTRSILSDNKTINGFIVINSQRLDENYFPFVLNKV